MSAVYFVTGATGFLGRHLLAKLSADGSRIYALVRPQSRRKIEGRAADNVIWVDGDIERPEVFAHDEDRERVTAETTCIIHAAALYDLEATHEALYWGNIVGTHHLVHLANQFPKLRAFHFVSTMAVAGDYAGNFTETMFNEGQSFPNRYAATKFAAEACVRDWETPVPRFVHRLGILVGDSVAGVIPKIDGPYYLLRALHGNPRMRAIVNRLRAIALPFNDHARVYLVPVDVAADAIVTVARDSGALPSRPLRVYHVMGESGGIPVRVVLRKVLAASGIEAKILALPSNRAVPWIAERFGVPPATLHYMYSPCRYEMRRLAKDFPAVTFPKFDEYADTIFRYARERLMEGGTA